MNAPPFIVKLSDHGLVWYFLFISGGFLLLSGISLYIASLFQKAKLQRRNELFEAMIHTQEYEQQRIGTELHDSLNPLISSIKLKVEVIRNRVEKAGLALEKEFQSLEVLLDHSAAVAREAAHNLMPVVLKKGYVPAVKNYLGNLSHHNLSIELYERNFPQITHPFIQLNLYRVVQELVNNAIRHANAEYIKVYLFSQEHTLQLIVKDNGVWRQGREGDQMGMGHHNIRNRVNLLMGTCRFYENKPNGFAAHLKFDTRKWKKRFK